MNERIVYFSLHHEFAKTPSYATHGSSGMDLYSVESVILPPSKRALINTGVRISLPDGYEAQVRPRSGLAIKKGITVLNAPGTIDQDYQGEIQVILMNCSDEQVYIEIGDRIAQLVIAEYTKAEMIQLNDIREVKSTERAEGGFGHTGDK